MKFSIGIDIGGTNTEIGIVDKQGCCLKQDSFSTVEYKNLDSYSFQIHKIIQELLQKKSISLKEIQGIGIGAPNANYKTGIIHKPPNLILGDDIPIVDSLKKYYDFPIILTNDAKAAALGEGMYGGAKGMRDYIMITLGTGLGCGIVANGDLIYGHCGLSGEWGHCGLERGSNLPDIDDFGNDFNLKRECTCGKKNCIETYVNVAGIKQTYQEFRGVSNLDFDNERNLTVKEIANLAQKGDKRALETLRYTAEILGEKMADLGQIFAPESIFLSGGISKSGETFLQCIRENFENNLLFIYKNKIKIQLSHLQSSNVGILGASSLVWT